VNDLLWIDAEVALAVHSRLLTLEGGAFGIRDLGLLQSALARPQQLFAYGHNPGIVDMAAAYAVGIVRDHPFIDGNKRTALVVASLFLELNGFRFTAAEEGAAPVMLSLAAGALDEPAFTAWLRSNSVRA